MPGALFQAGVICVRSPSQQMAQRGLPSHGQSQEAAGGGEGSAGLWWGSSGSPWVAPPHGRPWTLGWSQMRKLARQRPPGHWETQRACVQTRWPARLLSPAAVLTEGRPPAWCQLSGPVSPITKGSPGAGPPPWSLLPRRGGGLPAQSLAPCISLERGTKGERLPASSRAYFLLSSLARQVAASTALMVAARSPPCSRACSP